MVPWESLPLRLARHHPPEGFQFLGVNRSQLGDGIPKELMRIDTAAVKFGIRPAFNRHSIKRQRASQFHAVKLGEHITSTKECSRLAQERIATCRPSPARDHVMTGSQNKFAFPVRYLLWSHFR